MAYLFDPGIFSVDGLDGEILPGAKLYWYQAGTSTPLATYSDQDLTIPNTNPVLASADGRFPSIWLQAAEYKLVLKSFDDITLTTREPIDATSVLSDIEGDGGGDLVGYKRVGDNTQGTTQSRVNQRYAHLFDYIPAAVDLNQILNNTSTIDLAGYLQAAIDDIPPAGGVLILPPCDLRVSTPISIGNGVAGVSVSTKNGQVIRCDSMGGTDEGTFGGGQRAASTRILYVGASAPSSYLLTMYGPIRNVSLKGVVLDCNGLCGYPINMQHLIECDIDVTGTRWTTGQGIAYVPDLPLPPGCTLGFFKNKIKIRTKLPWQSGALKRGTQGFLYYGGVGNNQGFSKNVIECEHVFDDAGTFAMWHRFIDNNQFRDIWTRTSDGLSPTANPLNAGKGIVISVPNTAVVIGENIYTGNIGGGVDYAFDSGATVANKWADYFQSYGLLDYEPMPTSPLAKVYGTDGSFNNGFTGSLTQWIGRHASTLSTTTTPEYLGLIGQNTSSTSNRLDRSIYPGRTGYIPCIEVNLGTAPGGTASRTFTVHVNGVATGATITFGSGESGWKRTTLTTPFGALFNADVCLYSTFSGTPAASSVGWSVGFNPTERVN